MNILDTRYFVLLDPTLGAREVYDTRVRLFPALNSLYTVTPYNEVLQLQVFSREFANIPRAYFIERLWVALLRFFVLQPISCRWSKFSYSKRALICKWWKIYWEAFSVFNHFHDIALCERLKTYLNYRSIFKVIFFVLNLLSLAD